ncbi:MAG: peroxidase [Actinomycetota bacterium]|nr:peroxidase [Actinomycetota bacterium]
MHHRRGLRRLLKDDDLLVRVEADWTAAGLGIRREAMLRYATKLTEAPATVAATDIDDMRSSGLSDRDILDVCEVTAYYAYVNRIADGLGVELEDWIPDV